MRQPATTNNTNTDSNSITSEGYAALIHILCSSSSILITHRSNHTYEILCNESNKQMLTESIKSPFRTQKKEQYEPSSTSQDHHGTF